MYFTLPRLILPNQYLPQQITICCPFSQIHIAQFIGWIPSHIPISPSQITKPQVRLSQVKSLNPKSQCGVQCSMSKLESSQYHHRKSSQYHPIVPRIIPIIQFWLVVSTPLKNIRQLGWLFPMYGKIKKCSKPPTSYYTIGLIPMFPRFQSVFSCWCLVRKEWKWGNGIGRTAIMYHSLIPTEHQLVFQLIH